MASDRLCKGYRMTDKQIEALEKITKEFCEMSQEEFDAKLLKHERSGIMKMVENMSPLFLAIDQT